MTVDVKTQLEASKLAYRAHEMSEGDTISLGHEGIDYTVEKTFVDPNTGFKAMALKSGDDLIMAFAGTEGLQDAHADISLGWDQWTGNRPDISKFMSESIQKNSNINLHLAGHSLGGALAQYAAYSLREEFGKALNIESGFTINGLGGEAALRQAYDNYDPSLLNNVAMANYRIENDLVSRLGEGHLGDVYLVDSQERTGFVDAHLLGTAIDFFNEGLFGNAILQGAENVDYLKISDAQKYAAQFANFTNGAETGDIEAFFRSVAGVAAVLGATSPVVRSQAIEAISEVIEHWAEGQKNSFASVFTQALLSWNVDTETMHALTISFGPTLKGIAVASELVATAEDILNVLSVETNEIIETVTDIYGNLVRVSQQIFDIAGNEILPDINSAFFQATSDLKKVLPMAIDDTLSALQQAGSALTSLLTSICYDAVLDLFETFDGLVDGVSDLFDAAQSAVLRRDPLTLDLDGDGLETLGIDPAVPILFDHDADGIKTATGWIKPDDAFLVLDRNSNGTIDDGTELFGDSTPLMDEEGNVVGTAEDGFAALAREDTNGDGVVDAGDDNFADLRVWRDLNSDGVSQADELQSLDEAGIAAINIAKTENFQPLPDGNLLADLGSFVRTDGSQGGVGAVSAEMGDIDLIEDTFHSEFADSIPLTPEAVALPNMGGSGRVRNLQEAASLSPELAGLLSQYARAATRAEQLALLDQLVIEWGKTSDLAVTGDGAYDGTQTLVSIAGYPEGSAGYEAWMTKLQTLERFNGRPFGTPTEGAESVSINLFNARQSFLNQAYDALKQSVYDGLLLQTRLKPYMDALELTIDQNGLGMDFTGTDTTFQARFDEAPAEAVRDLLDLQRIAGTDLNGMSWDGYGQLRGWLGETADNTDDLTLIPAIVAALGDFGYPGLQIQSDGTDTGEAVIGDLVRSRKNETVSTPKQETGKPASIEAWCFQPQTIKESVKWGI